MNNLSFLEDIIAVWNATKGIYKWGRLALVMGILQQDYVHVEKQFGVYGIITKWLEGGEASMAILVSALWDELINVTSIGNNIARHHPRECACKYYIRRHYIGLHVQVRKLLLCLFTSVSTPVSRNLGFLTLILLDFRYYK